MSAPLGTELYAPAPFDAPILDNPMDTGFEYGREEEADAIGQLLGALPTATMPSELSDRWPNGAIHLYRVHPSLYNFARTLNHVDKAKFL
ncbi:hypothetical protein BCR44DRAFT_35083 [Catenaria anguillulae PL171]|uniref:Uncharacterized protein n=1 Tax=Catenaria anguillulae PL171 TaxID=765915 RepID=A0A1Y2HED6_9FUNG|nr:hypothetical protein BCR44DRAFT_35083 [Catenaria anguillulae PL171]